MTLDLQVQTARPSREQQIRDVFETHGRMMTIRDLAKACIADGIWSRDELNRIAVQAVQGQCRTALKQRDAAGIPNAGQTTQADDDGQAVWKARQLWLFDDYVLNVREHVDQRNENHAIALKIAAEGELRYRRPISVPGL